MAIFKRKYVNKLNELLLMKSFAGKSFQLIVYDSILMSKILKRRTPKQASSKPFIDNNLEPRCSAVVHNNAVRTQIVRLLIILSVYIELKML